MKSGSTDGQYSSVIRVLAVVAIAFMAVSAFASIPAEQTDADGKTVTVNSWDEFKDAVDAAGNGDTIVLGSDIKADDHDDVVIEDVSDLTIDLVGHVLDKGPGGRGYEETGQLKVCGGAVVTFKNGTLRGGGVDNGGGIYIKEGSNVTLIDVNIDDPYASDEGGGIFIKDSILTMKGGEVTSCDSENDGSFLRATDSSTVTLDGVKITENESGDGDGVIAADGGTMLTITNCEISQCHSSGDGGAIDLDGAGDVVMTGCTFLANRASGKGGAICTEDGEGTLTIKGCTFTNNRSGWDFDWDDGGAIFIDGGKVVIGLDGDKGCVFTGNYCYCNGGAVRVCSGDVEVKGAVFESNYTFEDKGKGGAFYLKDCSVLLEDCTITKNKGAEGVGGIYIGSDVKIKMQGHMVVKDNEHGSDREGFLGVSNVYIEGKNVIECGTFADGTEIGIELDKKDRVFTKGYSDANPGKDPASFFKAEDGYYVALDPDSKEAKFYSGSSGDISGDNNVWVIVGVAAVIVAIIAAIIYVRYKR